MKNQQTSLRRAPAGHFLLKSPALLGFVASLMAVPVHASITLPTDPLATSARVAPNILLLLDDSTSMNRAYMPDTVPRLLAPGDNHRAYTRNTVYYNPHVDYQPWVDASGVAMVGGMNYSSAFASSTQLDGSVNLADSIKTYYVPRDPDVALNPGLQADWYLRDPANYYRYEITTQGRVVRSELNAGSAGVAGVGCDDWRQWNDDARWGGCTFATPTGRTESEELQNFATWYSYHRTRMKAAKAGVSLAFSQLGADVRVGFRTISSSDGFDRATNAPTHRVPIPVHSNQGLFDDPNGAGGAFNNRTRWFARMQQADVSGSTPLRQALDRAGQYFQSTGANGPYGPNSNGQLACRQNFTILTTDGYWNSSAAGSYIGDADNTAGSLITGPGGRQYQYTPNVPYSSSDSDNLADVAMYYWKNDLRPDMPNIVPTTSSNPAFWQHMVTFGISIGLRGTLDQGSVAEVLRDGSPRSNGFNVRWPTDKIDDLLHAAVNGHGEFIAASNPQALATGLQSTLAAITQRTGSFSNVGANSTSVDGGTRIYQASYVSGVWTGDVQAYSIFSSGAVDTAPSWRASAGIPASGRKIFAGNDDATAAVAFPSGLSDARRTQLTRTGVINYPVTGADNAAYLAGDRSNELRNGGTLRNRNHLLGDIVSSSPAYVPETETLYIGSNDGMMHAIDATNGNELFAYIPGGINWSDLAGMSRPDYGHRYFVDGPIVVSTKAQGGNKNILVGALGKGGKGLYALDVTTPGSFGASDFKWEVRGQSELMGLVQAKPIIARLNNGVTAVIVANGVNSTSGRAGLLMYNLQNGNLIEQIDTGVGSAVTDSADANGLTSAVGWDADGNGTVDYVYGGDMLGNVWKFDLASGSTATWGVLGNAPLFTATNADGQRQPITGGLTIAFHPRTYMPWIFFGTGRLMTTGDMTTKTVQSLYGFVDDGTAKARSGASANLTRRSIQEAATLAGAPVRAFERRQPLPAGSKGWYIDLLTPQTPPAPGVPEGERVVSDAQLYGDVLVVSSVIPTADACQADGRGYLNALDAYTGTSTGPSLFDLDGDGMFEDEVIGNDKLPVGSVDLGVGMPTLAELLRGLAVVGGSSGNLGNVRIREARNVGRVSWREVLLN